MSKAANITMSDKILGTQLTIPAKPKKRKAKRKKGYEKTSLASKKVAHLKY